MGKKRPAIILVSRGQDHLGSFCTSRVDQAGPDNVRLVASTNNGLAVDSAALVTKLFTLHESLIVRALGHLSSSDHRAVVERLANLLRESLNPRSMDD